MSYEIRNDTLLREAYEAGRRDALSCIPCALNEQKPPPGYQGIPNLSGGGQSPAQGQGGKGAPGGFNPSPTGMPDAGEDWDQWGGDQAYKAWKKLQDYCKSSPGGCFDAYNQWLKQWESFCNTGACEPWWSDMLGIDPGQMGWGTDTWAGMPGMGGM
mgnify:CR=1 FL=1